VISSPFEYRRASSLDDALAKLNASNGEGKFIAGGHSLVPLMKLRLSEPTQLIDIAHIPGLSGIREKGGKIEIGAGTVHHDVAASALLRKVCPAIAECAASIGDPQVRNRGTLGGSLAHADPAADYPAVMLALDAEIQLKSAKRERAVKATDFFQGMFTVDLAADEIIVGVQFAPVKSAAYAKLHQRASHFAIVGVAAAVDVKSGVIQSARIGVTGASSHATRLTDVEKALAGKPASAASVDAAAKGAGAKLQDVNSDIHASEEYRRAMVEVFTGRALKAALEKVKSQELKVKT
jgi:carbon-monoxide dehydrogenase medium subunit